MPKENKSTSRRTRRQCSEGDNESAATSNPRETVKSTSGSNRYSPFPREVPRRDTKLEKKTMASSSIEILRSTSDGIIGSGIKYIMFPLHLLRFCIFGTTSGFIASDKGKEMRQATINDEICETEEKVKDRDEKNIRNSETSSRRSSKKDRESSQPCSSDSSKENLKEEGEEDNEESIDEMVTAAEDSDSSVDHWSSASSMMNMSVDYDNIDRSISYTLLEEPMDISFEEQTYDKSRTAIKSLEDNEAPENCPTDATKSKSLKSRVDEQDSNSSVDEEIARIFQKQCTSSDDEVSFSNSKSLSSGKLEKKNFLSKEGSSRYSTNVSRSKRESRSNDRGQKKKTSSDIVANHKRRKVVDNEYKDEKRCDDRTETKKREDKRESRQNTPSKSKPRSSKTSVKEKDSKRRDIKYKETATQTDSAFSDDDVEMIPVETKSSERQFCCKHAAQRLQSNLIQGMAMEQELNYTADNEDSNDGYTGTERKRISPSSTSSSSTDLGFDERVFATPDVDVAIEQWCRNSPDSIKKLRMGLRAPPGFPELPQNPPLTSHDCNNSKYFTKTVLRDGHSNSSAVPSTMIVPRAPSPMRHLYYDYPEFMDLPVNINSSRFLKNILRNNYYR